MFPTPSGSSTKPLFFRAVHPASGRFLEVSTTEPVFISYSCYYLDFLLKNSKCKDGVVYEKSGGLLFMPQGYPAAVNIVSVNYFMNHDIKTKSILTNMFLFVIRFSNRSPRIILLYLLTTRKSIWTIQYTRLINSNTTKNVTLSE